MVLTDVNGFLSSKKASIKTLVVSHNDNIPVSYFTNVKHTLNFMETVALNKRFQNPFTIWLDEFYSYTGKERILIYAILKF